MYCSGLKYHGTFVTVQVDKQWVVDDEDDEEDIVKEAMESVRKAVDGNQVCLSSTIIPLAETYLLPTLPQNFGGQNYAS